MTSKTFRNQPQVKQVDAEEKEQFAHYKHN